MSAAITGVDHVLVGVRDLELARETYTRLGFTCTPRGSHIGWGTANYCIMFADDYVELLGVVDPTKFTNRLDEFLDRREGLMGLASGLFLLSESMDKYWDDMYPPARRIRARVNAIGWLTEKLDTTLPETQVGADDHDAVAALDASVVRLRAVVAEKFTDESPSSCSLIFGFGSARTASWSLMMSHKIASTFSISSS